MRFKRQQYRSILVGKTFGLGNAVMAVPMVKAIRRANPTARIDVLVGSKSDDCGAREVFEAFMEYSHDVDNLYIDSAPADFRYEVAVMAIPFDGRWINGRDFFASECIDGKGRPDPDTDGLVSWQMHEIEYQMQDARELGYTGYRHVVTPTIRFTGDEGDVDELCDSRHFNVYLGLGYKKDMAGQWREKHWGNENFARLIEGVTERDVKGRVKFVATGDTLDQQMTYLPILRSLSPAARERLRFERTGFKRMFDIVRGCQMYVGNDTGTMHVAASFEKKVCCIFMMDKKSMTKNAPWCSWSTCFWRPWSHELVEEVCSLAF